MQPLPSPDDAPSFQEARALLLHLRDDPAAAVREFRWPRPPEFNWALDHFDAMALDPVQGALPALWITGEDGAGGTAVKLSYAELSAASNRVANHLRALGVQRGDRILLMLGNELALWEVMLAAIKLGAVLIPATALLTPDDLRDRLQRGEVRHVVTASAQAHKFDELPGDFTRLAVGAPVPGWLDYAQAAHSAALFTPDAPTRADDPMLLYFTSGTTALPKLVLHTHTSYPIGHLSTMYWLGLRPGDLHLNISSPGWGKHAWSCFFGPFNAGACVFIFNQPRFATQPLLAALAEYQVTSLCAPPTVWRMLIQEDLGAWRPRLALREVIGAGEPLNPEVIAQVQAGWGLTLRDGYGQTETTALVGNTPGQPVVAGSMGRPLPGYDIRLLNADGHEAAPGEAGEVCIALRGADGQRPVGLMAGYQGSPEKNAEVMIEGPPGDPQGGHYRTGDVAVRSAEGFITFVGRADDVFKASDYRISPFELESVLMEHVAVAEAAIVPSPDPLRLAVPKACVTLTAGHTADAALAEALLRFTRERLAPYKRIRRLEFVVELPKTISGKIRRVQLRTLEAERRAAGTRVAGEWFEEDFPSLKDAG